MTRARLVLREAAAIAQTQLVASLATVFTVAAMVLAVMLTTGRSVGSEEAVLGSFDTIGTRTIVIRAEPDAGLTSDAVERIARIGGVTWSGGFSAATDSTNSANHDGIRVPVRRAYGAGLTQLGIPRVEVDPGNQAYASPFALQQLGMLDVAGSVTLTTGRSFSLVGQLATPAYLEQFEPLVLVPQLHPAGTEPLGLIVVVAATTQLVAPVSRAVLSVLAPRNGNKVAVQTSEDIAQLRGIVRGQLGTFARSLTLVMLGITAALVAAILYALVTLRRKDFGRRRALGATRGTILALLLAQTGLLALAGVVVGMLASLALLLAGHDPLPPITFWLSIAVLATTTALAAAVLPALAASRRDPIKELRVP